MPIYYSENQLDDGQIEFEAKIEVEGLVSWLFGKMERNEFENMLKKIYFY